jgi:hypothetical protein
MPTTLVTLCNPSTPERPISGRAHMEPSAALYKLGKEIGRGSYGVVFEASRGFGSYVAKRFKEPLHAAEDALRACLIA